MPRPSRDAPLLTALVAVGAVLRVMLARGDLWLDELWSLSFARQIAWPWDVLTVIHHDNNHPLNTLALFLTVKVAGAHASPILYRLLPLAAGIATIPLVFWTESRSTDPLARARAGIAAALCACSFLAVVYSSEARGYAPAAFFAVLAFAMVRTRDLANSRERARFAIVCALGLLSHLTFLFVYAGLTAWTLARVFMQRGPSRDLRSWIALHQIPLVVIVGIYLVDARKLVYGGGPAFTFADVVTRVLSFAAGGPDAGSWKWIAMSASIAVVLYAAWLIVRTHDDEGIFFATSLIVAPALVLLIYHARFLDVRYFFVVVPFLWILAARALAHLSMHGALARAIAAFLLVACIVANITHLVSPLREGRGHYKDTLATMASLTTGDRVSVGSDHDFRNRLVIDYYGEEHPAGKTIVYAPSADVVAGRAEWYLTHTIDPAGDVIPPSTISPGGQSYVWVRSFKYGGVSGWNWHLYRRQTRP